MSFERVFLVTGATGAVGSAILPLLLSEPRTKVHALIRADSDDALAARLQSLRQYWSDAVDGTNLSERLVALRGDVCAPRLGLSEQTHEGVARTVTHIIHSAGNVKLNEPLEAARTSAVAAAQQVLRFARACAVSGVTPKLEYVSTVGVAGRRDGLIREQPVGADCGYHNTYEQAKAEAESLMLRELEAGVPVTIHRPSMVVGDSRHGRVIHFQVFYHLARFLAGSFTKGVLPRFGDVKLDLVPVDYVAKAIVASSRRTDATGRILHLCSGPSHAAPLAALGESVRRFLSDRGERVYTPRYVPRALLRMLLRTTRPLASARTRRALAALPYFLDYLDEAQLFDDAETRRFFAPEGLDAPAIEQYLPAVLAYWYAHRAPHADAD